VTVRLLRNPLLKDVLSELVFDGECRMSSAGFFCLNHYGPPIETRSEY